MSITVTHTLDGTNLTLQTAPKPMAVDVRDTGRETGYCCGLTFYMLYNPPKNPVTCTRFSPLPEGQLRAGNVAEIIQSVCGRARTEIRIFHLLPQ